MELKEIDYMLAIAEHGSFLKAAEALHITQSALSKYIHNMEARLGYDLFLREKKNKLILSDEGELFVHYAKHIDNERSMYYREVEKLHRRELRIRVGIGLVLNRSHITEIMEDFKRIYPDCNVYICSQWMRQNVKSVIDGSLDFAFAYHPDREYDDTLAFDPIFDDDILLAIPASNPVTEAIRPHPVTGMPWIDIHLLKDEPFILQNEQCHVRGPINRLFEDLNFIPNTQFSSNSTSATITMAERGLGIAACTATLSGDHPGVRFATVDDLSHSIPNGMIVRRDKMLSQYSRCFIELFKKYNGSQKYSP